MAFVEPKLLKKFYDKILNTFDDEYEGFFKYIQK